MPFQRLENVAADPQHALIEVEGSANGRRSPDRANTGVQNRPLRANHLENRCRISNPEEPSASRPAGPARGAYR